MSNGRFLTWHFVSQLAIVAVASVAVTIYVEQRFRDVELQLTRLTADYARFRDEGPRFTSAQGAALQRRLEGVETELRSLPPQWFRDIVDDLREDLKEHRKDHNGR